VLKSRDVYAIIPARGGSKGVPRKNIKTIAGKPLIAYSIEAAINCPRISRVIVSTEDAEIKQISLNYGADIIDRPVELASDSAQTHQVVSHVLKKLKKEECLPQYFVVLQPTSPLRKSKHITNCIDNFFESNAVCAISVTEVEDHPYKNFTLENEFLKPLFKAIYFEMRRQDLPKVLRPNGAIFLMPSETFLLKNVFYIHPAMPFLMSNEESIDIDSEFDFLLAELYLKGIGRSSL